MCILLMYYVLFVFFILLFHDFHLRPITVIAIIVKNNVNNTNIPRSKSIKVNNIAIKVHIEHALTYMFTLRLLKLFESIFFVISFTYWVSGYCSRNALMCLYS